MALQFAPRLFAPGYVATGTAAALYTAPLAPSSAVVRNLRVRIANPTGGAVTIALWLIPNAGATANSNSILPSVSVAAGSYLDVAIPVMAAGDQLMALAGAGTSLAASCLDGFIQS